MGTIPARPFPAEATEVVGPAPSHCPPGAAARCRPWSRSSFRRGGAPSQRDHQPDAAEVLPVSRSLHRTTTRLLREAPRVGQLALRGRHWSRFSYCGATALAGSRAHHGHRPAGRRRAVGVALVARRWATWSCSRPPAIRPRSRSPPMRSWTTERSREAGPSAMAGGRWKDLMVWSVITVAPDRLRRIASPHTRRSPRLTSPAFAGPESHAPASLISLLALPVPVKALEAAGVPHALSRSTPARERRAGETRRSAVFVGAPVRSPRSCRSGSFLSLGGPAVALAADAAVLRGLGLIAAGLGVVLATSGLAIHNASRGVLAVALVALSP